MSIYILGEDIKRFMPIVRILQQRDVPFRIIHAGEAGLDLLVDPARLEGSILYNRASPSSRTRGFRGAIDFARSILELFRAQGVSRILNDRTALDLEGSKAAQVVACQVFHIPVPRTYIAHGKEACLEIASHKLRLPPSAVLATLHGPQEAPAWYVKADRGGSSHDVVRCTSLQNVSTAVRRTDSPTAIWIIQQEVVGPYALRVNLTREQSERRARGAFDAAATRFHMRRTHYRLEIINHCVLYVLRIRSTGMTRDLCPCADEKNTVDTSFEIVHDEVARIIGSDMWDKFARQCIALTRHYDIFSAAFEFAIDSSNPPRPVVFDVACGNTNYNEAAELRAHLPPEKRGYEAIASYLIDQLALVDKKEKRGDTSASK